MANILPRTIRTPYYEVWMDGERLSPFLHSLITNITFNDSASEASTATISVTDPDYILLDDPRIVRSTPMKLYGGWVNDNRLWLTGYISTVDANFPDSGPPVVEIMLMDESFMMDTLPRTDLFRDMTSDQIAQRIAQRYGLKFVGDTGPRQYSRKVQTKQTDIKFLRAVADEEWFLIRVINGTLYWKKRSFQGDSVATYWYRRPPFDILSFNPRVVQADRVDGLVDSGINPETGKTESQIASGYNPPAEAELLGKLEAGDGGGSDGYVQYDPESGKWTDVIPNETS